MKRPALVALVCLLPCAAPASAAPIVFGLHTSASGPMGDYGDHMSTGFQGILSGSWMLNRSWGVGADVGYQRWGGNEDFDAFFQEGDELSGATPPSEAEVRLSAIQTTAHALYLFPTRGHTVPWIKAGLGAYVVSSGLVQAQRIDLDASSTHFGFHAGAGINLRLSGPWSAGVSAGYQRIRFGDAGTRPGVPPASLASGDDNWYPLFFESADTFTFGLNLMWGAPMH